MDSTQIASNIREMSRLQLLVEVAHRVQCMLPAKPNKPTTPIGWLPYCAAPPASSSITSKAKNPGCPTHLGELFQTLLRSNSTRRDAFTDDTYQLLGRVFREQFTVSAAAQP